MIEFQLRGVPCRVSLLFPALLTTLLFCQPDGLAAACLLASVIHEGGHLLAMLLLQISPQGCILGAFGLRIQLGGCLTGYRHSLYVAAAGPLLNGVSAVIFLLLNASEIALVHVLLALLNLLPVSVLDGGELLRCALCLCGVVSLADRIVQLISWCVISLILIMGFCLVVQRPSNPTLLIVGVYLATTLFFSRKNEKTS